MEGNYEAAIKEYDGLLQDEPGSMIVANNLASLLTDHRTDKPSLERARALAAALQQSQVPYFKDTLGWVQFRSGEFKSAVSLLEQAASELPRIAVIRYHLGESYLAVGQNDKARDHLKEAQVLAPKDLDLQEKIAAAMKRGGLR